MSDVTLSYKGSDILELSDSGSATLKTGGTYCEADIEVEYVKPSGGGEEKVLTKLAEYSIQETIRTFTITLTEEMQSKSILVVRLINITKDQSDWLYLRFNEGPNAYYASALTTTDDIYLFNVIGLQYANNQPVNRSFLAGSFIGGVRTNNSLANGLSLYAYSAAKNLVSGTIEIWG